MKPVHVLEVACFSYEKVHIQQSFSKIFFKASNNTKCFGDADRKCNAIRFQ